MVDHLRGPGFFTTVAATAILGSQYMVLAHNAQIGQIFWAVALVLWFGFTYTIFTVLTVKRDKPTLDRSEEHTSELQSLMRITYAVFCLKEKKTQGPSSQNL